MSLLLSGLIKERKKIMSDAEIIAFYSPYTGAGKTTMAKILDDNWSIILSFADPLYRYAEYLQPELSRKEDNGKTFDEFGGKSLCEFLIYLGQAGRAFYADIWSKKMRRSINFFKPDLNIIIDDLRFCNEYAMLREEGAKIVRITNPGRDIIKTEPEALLEDYEFDYQLINYKRGLEEYRTQLAEMMRELWP